MKATMIFAALIGLASAAQALTPTAPAGAATGQAPAAHAHEAFNLVHANDLAGWMKTQTAGLYIFDANNPETRAKEGIIPGAKLLDSSARYSTSMLPADKSAHLVFYCANTECMASHSAAHRATDAGYKNVSVMADGITGWKKAGQQTAKAPTNG